MRVLYIFVALWMICCVSDAAFAMHKKKVRHRRSIGEITQSLPQFRSGPSYIYGTSELASQLTNYINATNAGADIAVYIKSMQRGDSLYSRNIYRSLTPASTLKILTAEAALIYLGSNYRFSTQLLTDAKTVKNGVLDGNLYIVLSGDPTLTYSDLVELLMNLRTQQIHSITGNIYIDDSAYDQRFYGPGWAWKDKNYCYAAPIGASIINHNCLPIRVAPSQPGQAAQVLTSPNYFYPTIRNSVVTKSSRSRSCGLRLSTDVGSMISLDGCMTKGRYASGVSYVIANIPEYNRALFKSLLARLSITVYGSVTFATAPDNLSLVGSHASKPMNELVKEMLKKSDNIIAGAIFKKIGQLYSRQPGGWENGSVAVSRILSKHVGMNTSGLRILDGSGLSPDNLATPAQMMQVLDYAFHSHIGDDFIPALPIAGVDGTLKHRMYNIARKVRAKTGTISGVVSLAGYAQSADKEPLAFVIMINGNKGMGWRYKALEDKIATALTKYKRSG